MNNQIVEISCEELDLVSGGCFEGLRNFGRGFVKPLGCYGKTGVKIVGPWSYKDVGDCSLSGNEKMGAVGTAIADTAIISGIMAAGYFVFNKIKALKH